MTEIEEKWREYLDTLGSNAAFVEGLIGQYLEDPAQVDERWRRIFDEVALGQEPGNEKPVTVVSFKDSFVPITGPRRDGSTGNWKAARRNGLRSGYVTPGGSRNHRGKYGSQSCSSRGHLSTPDSH